MCGEGQNPTAYERVDDLCLDVLYGIAKYNNSYDKIVHQEGDGYTLQVILEFPTETIKEVISELLMKYATFTSNNDGTISLLNGVRIRENKTLKGKQFYIAEYEYPTELDRESKE